MLVRPITPSYLRSSLPCWRVRQWVGSVLIFLDGGGLVGVFTIVSCQNNVRYTLIWTNLDGFLNRSTHFGKTQTSK